MENNENFNYTYCAKEQEEISRIRNKYTEKEESKLDRLRRLDKDATRKATLSAVILGTFGALVMGSGMSLVMTDLAQTLGIASIAMPLGIAIGAVGLIPVCLAYPLYNRKAAKEREKIAPEILRLSDELMK